MRKFLILGVSALLVLAACKPASEPSSAGAGGTGGTTSGSGGSVAKKTDDPRAPGVTADSIKVGVAWVDLSTIKDLIKTDNGDYVKAYQAQFDDINAKGGINGRKIEPVYAGVNPSGATGADAACTKLTQDEQVFVAIGFFLADNILCIVDTNATAAIGGAMTAERLAKAKAPWFTTEVGEDLELDGIAALAKAGKLGNKLAVVGAIDDQKSYEQNIQPLLAKSGITPVATGFLDQSVADNAIVNAEAKTFSEKFKSAGAEQVLVIGPNTAYGYLGGLKQSDYRPQLVFTSLQLLTAYTSNPGSDLSLLDRAISSAPYGPIDDQLTVPGITQTECLDIQKKAGLEFKVPSQIPKGDPVQAAATLTACPQVALLTAILKKAGPDLNYGTFKDAGDSLGDILLPGFPDPWHYGPVPSADGDPKIYVFQWNAQKQNWDRAPA